MRRFVSLKWLYRVPSAAFRHAISRRRADHENSLPSPAATERLACFTLTYPPVRCTHRAGKPSCNALASSGQSRDGVRLGRFDGLDCRSDTPCSSGFDSRALQPRPPPAVAKSSAMCYCRSRIRPADTSKRAKRRSNAALRHYKVALSCALGCVSARSCPHAAAMSRPMFCRTVVGTPAASRIPAKRQITSFSLPL